MKVLVCIPCLMTGGTEVQTLSLVEALVAAGHEPIVACYFEYAESMVNRYKQAGARVELLSPEGIRPSGLKDTVTNLWHGLKQIVKSERPNVAHVQYMAPGALPILILRALGMKKILATTHTPADIYSKKGLSLIRFLSKNYLTAFQCITERAENSYFGSSSLFDGKLTKHFTIYNNIPSHIEVLSEPLQKKSFETPITVGVVSRLEYIKGMDLVVPAFADAAKKNQHLRLLVVGDGSQRQLMEQQACEANLSERVTFTGRQPQSALQGYYDQIDILLMPSRSEGFGLTAIEGMARGCVPIVADTGGLPEVIDSSCGLLHAPCNIADIADKILQASKELDSMSNTAIKRAKIFCKESYYKQIESLYQIL